MSDQNSQGGSSESKEKEGFVKSLRKVQYKVFGPDSPLPEKWRVFNFIKYRIEDNKSPGQFERISREYIIKNTGIWENNFSRIIKGLIKDDLIEVSDKNTTTDTCSYRLSRRRFGSHTVAHDKKKSKEPHVDNLGNDVDKSCGQPGDNIKMMLGKDSQHQNDVSQHQNDEGMGTTIPPSLYPSLNLPRAQENKREETNVSPTEKEKKNAEYIRRLVCGSTRKMTV